MVNLFSYLSGSYKIETFINHGIFTFIMGLTDIVHNLSKQFLEYEKESVFYALVSTAAGVVGGVATGLYAAAYGANAVYASLAAIGGYIVSRVVVGVPTHLKNLYNLVTGAYGKEEKKPPAPALATAPAAA